jgi:hypothetical protein
MADLENVGDAAPTVVIDGLPHSGLGPTMTGTQLLALAGRSPEDTALYAEGHRGRRIAPGQVVPVQEGSRFRTQPRGD